MSGDSYCQTILNYLKFSYICDNLLNHIEFNLAKEYDYFINER